MAIRLVSGGANTTGPWVDVHTVGGKYTAMRFVSVGGYTVGTVQIQHSIVGEEATPINVGSGLASGADLVADEPMEQVRAVVGGTVVGTARVYVITGQ